MECSNKSVHRREATNFNVRNPPATMEPDREAYTTSYGLTRLCCTASWRPRRARFSSSRERMLKGKAPAFFCTSEKTARDVFILS